MQPAPSSSGHHHEAEDVLEQLGSLLRRDIPTHGHKQQRAMPPGLCSTSYEIVRLDLQHPDLPQQRHPGPAAARQDDLNASPHDTLTRGTAACADIQGLKHRVHTCLHSTHSHHALPVARERQDAFSQALVAAAASGAQQQHALDVTEWAARLTDTPTSWNTSLYSTIELEGQMQAHLRLLRELLLRQAPGVSS